MAPADQPRNRKNCQESQRVSCCCDIIQEISALEKSEEDIKNDLIYYIKQFLLKNDFVKDMISQKRDFENKNPNVNYVSKSPSMFKPSLVDITTKDDDEVDLVTAQRETSTNMKEIKTN